MTAKEKRALVISKAKPALGRNRYSQDSRKRECVFTPHTDGRYYSDCSSFVRWLYRLVAIALGLTDLLNIGNNTQSILANKKLKVVDCKIKNGIPTDVSALRVADLFMFRGAILWRTKYVGHVEIVSAISGNNVTLMGHGSGNPKTHGMKTYCRMRWLWDMAPPIKNRGLICVLRAIQDDPAEVYDRVVVIGGSVNVRIGPGLTEKIIGKVSKATTLVRTFKDTPKWYGVTLGAVDAYISKRYTEVLR